MMIFDVGCRCTIVLATSFNLLFVCIVVLVVKESSEMDVNGVDNFNQCLSLRICSATVKCLYESLQDVIANQNKLLSPDANSTYVAHKKRDSFTNPVLQGKEKFNFSIQREKNIPNELWNRFYDNENMRFLHYHHITIMGMNFLATLNEKQVRRFFKLLTANRYSDQLVPLISKILQCKEPFFMTQTGEKKKNFFKFLTVHRISETKRMCFKRPKPTVSKNVSILSNMELVALINRLTEKQLTHIPLTLEAFEIQTNLLKALKQLDFTLVGHYTKRLALYNQIHKCNLWNQMKHLKGFQLPLHYTTGLKGDLGITLLSLFLKFGADINQRDKNFCTPLMLTSQLGRTAFTEFLLTQGARVDLVDYKGYTALHYACAEGHVETAARLLLFGANPNALGAPRLQWETPLEISVNSRVVRARDMVKTLMNYDTNTKYQIPSRFYKNETSMLMKLLQFDKKELLPHLIKLPWLFRRMLYSRNSISSQHVVFTMIRNYFPEDAVLLILEREILNKNAGLLCATSDRKGRSLFWWSCKKNYPRVIYRLLIFFHEANANKYPGYIMCNPHALNNKGYSPIELLVSHMQQKIWNGPELINVARQVLSFKGNGGLSFLATALLSDEHTMRKVARVTFASTAYNREIIFMPPQTMSLDDLFLVHPTNVRIPHSDELTPFHLALHHGRRRAQRLVMKALALSFLYNIQSFSSLTELWCGIYSAAELNESSALLLMTRNYPFLIQNILTLISPGDNLSDDALVSLVERIPPSFIFESNGVGALENAVWYSMSPKVSESLVLFDALTTPNRILLFTTKDCREALLATHKAMLYYRRYKSYPAIKESLFIKKEKILKKLFKSTILDVHIQVLMINHVVAFLFIIISLCFIFWLFLVTRVSSIHSFYVDPMKCIPSSADSFQKAAWLSFRTCLFGYAPHTEGIPTSILWYHRLWILCRCVVNVYLLSSKVFWSSKDLFLWPLLLTLLLFLQNFFFCLMTSSKTEQLLHETVDFLDVSCFNKQHTWSHLLKSEICNSCEHTRQKSLHVGFIRPHEHRLKNTRCLKKIIYPWQPCVSRRQTWIHSCTSGSGATKMHQKKLIQHNPHYIKGNNFNTNFKATPSTPGVKNFKQFLIKYLSRQLKIPPKEYFKSCCLISFLILSTTFAPLVGTTFLCNFMSVYNNTELFELYRTSPLSAIFFEGFLILLISTLLFSFFKPFLIVFIILRQRLRFVQTLKGLSPDSVKDILKLDLRGHDLWEVCRCWTRLWRECLRRSDVLWKTAGPILNSFSLMCVTFLRLFIWSTGGEHLQTRLGLGIFQFVLITMFLVMFSTKEMCSYNQALTESWQWLKTFYISSRFNTIHHEILRNEITDITVLDTKELRILGVNVTDSVYRLVQLLTLPTNAFLLLTSIHNIASPMYL